MFASLDRWLITRLSVYLSSYGNWYADVEALATVNDNITGTVSLRLKDRVYTCTVVRGGLRGGVWRGRVVGGRGGLTKVLDPQFYTKISGTTILRDALQEAGEVLATSSNTTQLDGTLSFWTRSRRSAGAEIQALCEQVGIIWSALESGDVWVGNYQEKSFTGDYLLVDIFPEFSKIEVKLTSLDITPGMLLRDERIDKIIHKLVGEDFSTEVYFESRVPFRQ